MFDPLRVVMFGGCLACALPNCAAEPPALKLLFPAGGQVGKSVAIVATGKFPAWPVQVWSDSDEIQWSCDAEEGKLQSKISEKAHPGLHWVRLFDSNGASEVRPFLIGTAPELLEIEPNERIEQATKIDNLPTTLFGVLNKTADVDLACVKLQADDWLVATIDSAKWLQSPADVSLQLLDSRGFVLAENLDHVGLDPYLQYQATEAGDYFVRVFGFPATPNSTIAFSGGSDWIYRLRLEGQPQPLASALDFENQVELSKPTDEIAIGKHVTTEQAQALMLPARVGGAISQPQETNYLRFSARASTNYQVRVLARHFGSPLDPALAILDTSGKQLVQQDDTAQDRDPRLNWKAPVDGEFVITVSDFHRQGGADYRYLLWVAEQTPDFAINVPSDLISAKVGEETEVVVNITRELGFAEELAVMFSGLPDSVQCPVVNSIVGTESEKKLSLKLKAGQAFQGPLTILARSAGESPKSRSATAPGNRPLWLSAL